MMHCFSVREWYWSGIFLVFSLAVAGQAGDEEHVAQFRAAVEKSASSVVLVRGLCRHSDLALRPACSLNTGFFVSNRGDVLTSVYALAGCARFEVLTVEGKKAEAELVGLDQPSGLALLRTSLEETAPLVPAERVPEPGEWIVAGLAQPGGKDAALVVYSTGVLSSAEGSLKLSGTRWKDLLVSTLPIGLGGASAPLLNSEGRLVGVVLAVSSAEGRVGNCYGILWREVEKITYGLQSGSRRLGWLGVALEDPGEMEGAMVSAVLERSPAYSAGIRPNDLLLAVDDRKITDPSVLEEKILGASPGTEVRVKLLRGDKIITRPVRIGRRPILISRGHPLRGWPPGMFRHLQAHNIWNGDAEKAARFYLQAVSELRSRNEILQMRVRLLKERIRKIEKQMAAEQQRTAAPQAPSEEQRSQ